jgi:hypothetical protein
MRRNHSEKSSMRPSAVDRRRGPKASVGPEADIASLFRHPDLGYQGQVSRARAKTGETRRASIKQE